MSTLEEQLDALEAYPQAVKAAIMNAEDRMVDVIGVVHSNQSAVRELKRHAVSEMEDGEVGKRWQVTQGNTAKRSYNDSSLLLKLADDDSTILKTMRYLITTGVLRISWSYTNLMKLVRREGIDLSIAQHEIVDGDDQFDIGEVWATASPSFKPVNKEE